MKNTIILPTDFSECADNALDYAIVLTKELKCKLEIVHLIDVNAVNGNEINAHRVLDEVEIKKRDATSKIKKLELKIENQNLKCKAEIHFGKIESLFPKYTTNRNPKLIVMGTTGANNLVNKLIGSNTYRIIKNTQSPVLAVPDKVNLKDIKNITFLSDYRDKDVESVAYISKIAECFNAEINIVHVLNEESSKKVNNQKLLDNFQSRVKKEVDYTNISYELLYSDDTFNRVKTLIKESKPELIVSVMRKQSFLGRLFFGSLTEKMVYQIETPLLVIPE